MVQRFIIIRQVMMVRIPHFVKQPKSIQAPTGLNIEYDYSDTLNFEFDMHRSKTTTDNGLDSGMNAQGRVILGSAALSTKEYFFRDGDIPGLQLIGIMDPLH